MSVSSVIIVSGLPGSGKSTLATTLGSVLRVPVLAKDVIEAALWRQKVGPDRNSSLVAHEVLTSLAGSFLTHGGSAIIDSVATTEVTRKDWRELARHHGATFIVIVCECSDPLVHRARLEGRDRGIEGWPELTWSDVESVRRRWEQWTEPHLAVDAIDDRQSNLARALEYVRVAQAR